MYKLITKVNPDDIYILDVTPGVNWVGRPAMIRSLDRMKKNEINCARAPFDKMPAAADLCQKMLAYDPSARPSAAHVLEHEWFLIFE